MDCVIKANPARAGIVMVSALVRAETQGYSVAIPHQRVATFARPVLSVGNASLSAVPADNFLREGGRAVVAA